MYDEVVHEWCCCTRYLQSTSEEVAVQPVQVLELVARGQCALGLQAGVQPQQHAQRALGVLQRRRRLAVPLVVHALV